MERQREHFIVDGYNVLNSWPELIALQKDLSEARDRLIHSLAEYGAYEKYDVTLVFDALFTADEEHEEKINAHFEVIYTGEGKQRTAASSGWPMPRSAALKPPTPTPWCCASRVPRPTC